MKSRRHRSPRTHDLKCVQVVGQGLPVRLSSADAHRLVAVDHDGQYCSKRVFKDWRKVHPEHPARVRLLPNGRMEEVPVDGR